MHPVLSSRESGPTVARWRPGLAGSRHSEIFASSREACGGAAALALARDGLGDGASKAKDVLWVQDRASLRLTGRPYRPGLPKGLGERMIHVLAATCEDALFALEEGLRCRDFACVIGELAGNPKALDFTASRRLSLAAEKYGVPLYLVRLDATHDLSSARMRWEVRAAASPRPRWNADAPGAPAWHAELFRARAHPPGHWTLHDDLGRLAYLPSAHGEEGLSGSRSELSKARLEPLAPSRRRFDRLSGSSG